MSVRIKATNKYDRRPMDNAEVQIRWEDGGTSIGRTNSNGIYDTGVSMGTAKEVKINGRVVDGNTLLEDNIYFYEGY